MQAHHLCTSRDEYVEDRCIWIVQLKDGTQVFQDDDRPGVSHPSAWIRLGRYINEHPENKIVAMWLRFGTHIVELPSKQQLYMYSHGLLQSLNQKHGLDFHVVGWSIDAQTIQCRWYKVPELVVTKEFRRSVSALNPEQIIGDWVDAP